MLVFEFLITTIVCTWVFEFLVCD